MDNRVRVCLTCSNLLLKEETVCPECGSMEIEVLEEERPTYHDHVISHKDVTDIYNEFSDFSDANDDIIDPRKVKYPKDEFDDFNPE
jgi:phage FluMu protein Com